MCTYLQMKGSRNCYPIINTLAYIILCILFYKRGPMSKHFLFPKHRINFTYLFVHYLLGWSDTTLFVILENRHMLLIKYVYYYQSNSKKSANLDAAHTWCTCCKIFLFFNHRDLKNEYLF